MFPECLILYRLKSHNEQFMKPHDNVIYSLLQKVLCHQQFVWDVFLRGDCDVFALLLPLDFQFLMADFWRWTQQVIYKITRSHSPEDYNLNFWVCLADPYEDYQNQISSKSDH
jgi:hypothetical protein